MKPPALEGPLGWVGGTCRWRPPGPCGGRVACPEPAPGDQPIGAELPCTPQVDWLLVFWEEIPPGALRYALLLPWEPLEGLRYSMVQV